MLTSSLSLKNEVSLSQRFSWTLKKYGEMQKYVLFTLNSISISFVDLCKWSLENTCKIIYYCWLKQGWIIKQIRINWFI